MKFTLVVLFEHDADLVVGRLVDIPEFEEVEVDFGLSLPNGKPIRLQVCYSRVNNSPPFTLFDFSIRDASLPKNERGDYWSTEVPLSATGTVAVTFEIAK